jgi:hypothetical protein
MNESQRFAFMHPREPNRHSRYSHFSRHYTVTFSQWASARAGRNRCRQKLPVAIARSTERDSSLSAGKEAHAGRNIRWPHMSSANVNSRKRLLARHEAFQGDQQALHKGFVRLSKVPESVATYGRGKHRIPLRTACAAAFLQNGCARRVAR